MQTVLQITVVRVNAALASLAYKGQKQRLASIVVLLASVCTVAFLMAQNVNVSALLAIRVEDRQAASTAVALCSTEIAASALCNAETAASAKLLKGNKNDNERSHHPSPFAAVVPVPWGNEPS